MGKKLHLPFAWLDFLSEGVFSRCFPPTKFGKGETRCLAQSNAQKKDTHHYFEEAKELI